MYSKSFFSTPEGESNSFGGYFIFSGMIDTENFVGFLTIKDILKIEPQLFEIIVEKFELREEARKPVFGSDENEGICEVCGNYSSNLEEASDGSKVCSQCKGTI